MRLAAALGLLATAPLLAGCLGPADLQPQGLVPGLPLPGAMAARLRCVPQAMAEEPGATACNLLATLEPERQGNEVTIAVNPTNPANVVAGAKDYFPATAGDCVWDGVYHTQDGGASFTSGNIPGSPWLLLNDPGSFEPTFISQYWCATDPVVAFGPDGTLYYTILAYQGDPVTASKLGDGIVPANPVNRGGGLNDWAFNRVTMAVAVSTDGGQTFDGIYPIDSGSFPVNFHDRQWVAVDPSSGDVYVAWTTFFVPGNVIYRSTDKGRTWSPPTILNEQPTALGGPGGLYVDVGPEGNVYVSGCRGGKPMLTTSHDNAATFEGWRAVDEDAVDEGMEAEYRAGQTCRVAVDRSGSPHSGMVYMAWTDTRDGSRDIWFRAMAPDDHHGGGLRAMDHPEARPALKLNDDAGAADQFFPAISVSPTGIIDVAWWDRRNDPENRLLDVYHTFSLDGGLTWSPNLRVTEVSSDPVHSHHQNGMVFIGDYIDMDSSEDCAWPVWVDTRAQKADVMTACVERAGQVRS